MNNIEVILAIGITVFLLSINVLLAIALKETRKKYETTLQLFLKCAECEEQVSWQKQIPYLGDSGNIVLTYPYYEWRKGRDVIQSLTPIWTDEKGRPYENRHGKRWYLHPGDSWRNNSGYRTPP